MALLSTISEANRVVSQGSTWTVDSQIVFVYSVKSTTNNVTTTTTHRVWNSKVHLAKRYAYVGMTEAAARTCAADICNAYVLTQTKYALVYNKSSKSWSVISASNVEVLQASVTPMRVEGNVWQVEVNVAAEAEVLTDKTDSSSPTVSTLMGYLADADGYPEIQSPPLSGGAS